MSRTIFRKFLGSTAVCRNIRSYKNRKQFVATPSNCFGAQDVAVVQGASGGLGLEFVRQLLERPQQRFVSCVRIKAFKSFSKLHWIHA